jgi:hypothetical protein
VANYPPTASNATPVPMKNGAVIKPTEAGGNPPAPAGTGTDRTVGQHGDWPNGSWPT